MRSFASLSSLLTIAALALAACGDGSTAQSGSLDLAISDTPVDGATHVNLVFTSVTLQTDGSMSNGMDMMMMDGMGMADVAETGTTLTLTFNKPRSVDLLQQQGGKSAAVLSGMKVPAGLYTSITFMADPSRSTLTLSDGSVHPFVMKAGGMVANGNFGVMGDSANGITVDFDLRQAVSMSAGQYMLNPTLRVIDNMQVGRISGSAPNTALISGKHISDPACMPAAYVYAGANVTPMDINPASMVQPLTTATLKLNNSTGGYDYTAAFLPAGPYTVSFVCAALDDPTRADGLSFTSPQQAMVTVRNTSMVNVP